MGMHDTFVYNCPSCGSLAESQTKLGFCIMNTLVIGDEFPRDGIILMKEPCDSCKTKNVVIIKNGRIKSFRKETYAIIKEEPWCMIKMLPDDKKCKWCDGLIRIRNPTGDCDHLYYPDCVNKEFNEGNERLPMSIIEMQNEEPEGCRKKNCYTNGGKYLCDECKKFEAKDKDKELTILGNALGLTKKPQKGCGEILKYIGTDGKEHKLVCGMGMICPECSDEKNHSPHASNLNLIGLKEKKHEGDFSLSEKKRKWYLWGKKSIFYYPEEDVKTFIKKLNEGDLYREIIRVYGKAKIWHCNLNEICDLIEEHQRKKINKLAGEALIK